MQESKSKKVPSFQSIDEVVYFFDNSDMGEYWDDLPAADFEVQIKKRTRFIAIDEELMDMLDKMAQSKQISPETLVDSFLCEKAGLLVPA